MSDAIATSWKKNATEWVRIIESESIASRRHTNKAIVETLRDLPTNKILDCGCGEGWLTRAISEMGKIAVGTDTTETLIKYAKEKDKGNYHQLSYEKIMEGVFIPGSPFDAAVFNFSLYLKEGTVHLLQSIKKMLSDTGYIVIQTLHPSFLLKQGLAYESQWISDSWQGLHGNFVDGHEWYARTLEDWQWVFSTCGLHQMTCREILDENKEAVSVLFVLNKSGDEKI